jgi:hypothetical protein
MVAKAIRPRDAHRPSRTRRPASHSSALVMVGGGVILFLVASNVGVAFWRLSSSPSESNISSDFVKSNNVASPYYVSIDDDSVNFIEDELSYIDMLLEVTESVVDHANDDSSQSEIEIPEAERMDEAQPLSLERERDKVETDKDMLLYKPRTICVSKNNTVIGNKQVSVLKKRQGGRLVGGKCVLSRCEEIPSDPALPQYGFVKYNNPSESRAKRMMIPGTASSGAGCAISHRYKFIYIHVLKSGGSTLKEFLKRALCLTNPLDPTNSKCLMTEGPAYQNLSIVDCGPALRNYGQEYFVWSFVRHPFSRLYSGYAMATRGAFRKQNAADVTLKEFVMGSNIDRKSMSRTDVSHYFPQSHFLFNGQFCPVFDFLGRLEHFDRDMKVVLNHIQSPELNSIFYDNYNGTMERNAGTSFGHKKLLLQNKTKSKGGTHLKVSSATKDNNTPLDNLFQDDAIRQHAMKEFAVDFRLLGYLPNGIPSSS